MKRVLCTTLSAAAKALECKLNKRAEASSFTVTPLRDELGWVEVCNTDSGRCKRVKMDYTSRSVAKRTYIPWDDSYSINNDGETVDRAGNIIGTVYIRTTLSDQNSIRRNYSPKGEYDANTGFITTVDSDNTSSLDRLIRLL